MKCAKCKKNIDDGDLFCGYCGINQQKYAKYLEKVSNKVHKERDREYSNNVASAENRLKLLERAKQNEIDRLENSRWQNCGVNGFSYNLIEGKIKIGNSTYLFSEIKGAEIVKEDSFRMITTQTAKSKKHMSLGKAVVGGALLGPLGAVAGSTMGKTTTTGKAVSNSIPTCNHIGVKVDINGFSSEIVVLSTTIDQSNALYNNSLNKAQTIVDKLRELASTPVPKSFKKVEEEDSVLSYDSQIEEAEKELEKAKNNKPNYDIPESYLK